MNPLNLFSRHHHIKERLEALRPQLYRLAYSWTNNPALADDLTQEALTKALKNVAQLRNPDALKSWSFGILRNCWVDHFRSNREMDDLDNQVLADEHNTPERHHEQQNIVDKVRGAVSELPEGQRHVLTLIDLEGCSYAEVAEILDIPIGTVMSRLCRARKCLATKLLEFQPESADNVASLRRVV